MADIWLYVLIFLYTLAMINTAVLIYAAVGQSPHPDKERVINTRPKTYHTIVWGMALCWPLISVYLLIDRFWYKTDWV